MKQGLALVLAGILMLGLCGCGNQKSTMLSSAVEMPCAQIYEDISANRVAAEETYDGAVYTVTGYVTYIGSEGFDMIPLNPAYTDVGGVFEFVHVVPEKQDMTQIRKDDLITVVGKMDFEEGSSYQLKPAFLVGKTINISATVDEIGYFADEGKYYLPIQTDYVMSGKYAFCQCYWYFLGNEKPDEIIINDVVVKPGDRVKMEATAKLNTSMWPIHYREGNSFESLMLIESVENITVE